MCTRTRKPWSEPGLRPELRPNGLLGDLGGGALAMWPLGLGMGDEGGEAVDWLGDVQPPRDLGADRA